MMVEQAVRRRRYLNAPLQEAVFEARLPDNASWDSTLPGLMYAELRHTYLRHEPTLLSTVQVVPTEEGFQQHFQVQERTTLRSDDRSITVQIGPRLIAVSSSKPYPGWEEFREAINEAVGALTRLTTVESYQRLGLRYINRIPYGSSGNPEIAFERDFNLHPFFGAGLPQAFNSFEMQAVFPYRDQRDQCRVQLASLPPEEGMSTFLLDFDYYLGQPTGWSTPDDGASTALRWVEHAHEQISNLFENSISDTLRERFGEPA
jgi:uncharacterized protein (TIGR04255 family)